MEGNVIKGICIALLFVDTLLFGWPPYLLVRGSNHSSNSVRIRNLVISYLTCFAGGVFLGACLLHLLAEGREVMEEYFKSVDSPDTEFPIYEAVVAAGFFAIALVEQIAHTLLHNSHLRRVHSQHTHNGTEVQAHQTSGTYTLKRGDETGHDRERGSDNHAFTKERYSQTSLATKNFSETNLSTNYNQDQGSINGSHTHLVDCYSNGTIHKTPTSGDISNNIQETNPGTIVATGSEQSKTGLSSRFSTSTDGAHDHDGEMVQIVQVMGVNPLRAFLLLGALSFHTLFDGLAIGLQDEETDIWEVFIAICIHKSLVAVCLGLQLFLAFRSKPIMGFIWVFVFSLISPIGIGTGMALTSGSINHDAELLTNWILQGLATGTFLYVTIFEILREEFTRNGSFLRILIAMVGFGGMAVAKYFDKD